MKQCCAIDSITTKKCENLIPATDEVCFLHLREFEFWMDVLAEKKEGRDGKTV